MFIFLLYFLLNITMTHSKILIQDSGVEPIRKDDIALIFFLTLENTFDRDANISLKMLECTENGPFRDTSGHICLIGGDMGVLYSQKTKNVTMIYPNSYLRGRSGQCLISINYSTTEYSDSVQKSVQFSTNYVSNQAMSRCSTADQDDSEGCQPVDCVVKYSSKRSYFNSNSQTCGEIPDCPFDTLYLPDSNTCRKLDSPVCKNDLQLLEDGHYEKSSIISDLVNFRCHHGSIDNKTGICVCYGGWVTSLCSEGPYQPTLGIYHMCNIEMSSWQDANQQKMIMTILAIVILALCILAKMLIALCILNWCCNWFRSKRQSDEEICDLYHCPHMTCGDESCSPKIPDDDEDDDKRSSRTTRVSFCRFDEISCASGNTEISLSNATEATDIDSEGTHMSEASSCLCGK